ncbi:MAG: hypothetical protein FJX42_12415, partial [Alphaproteobacteria bacterium]|nr:hypothetical protein [Alphaproteobacteria bacterium]
MTTVTPPPAAPPQPAPSPAPQVSAVAVAAADALLKLPPAAKTEGLILQADPGLQKLTVQTPQGPVALQLSAPLPVAAGQTLALQLTALTPAVQFLILSVDGETLATLLRRGGPAEAGIAAKSPSPGAAVPSAPPTVDRVHVGTTVQAMLLRPASAPVVPPIPGHAQPKPGTAGRERPVTQPAPAQTRSREAAIPATPPSRPTTSLAAVAATLRAAIPEKVAVTISSWMTTASRTAAAAVGLEPQARAAVSAGSPAPGSAGATPFPPGTAFAVRLNAPPGAAAPAEAAGGALRQGAFIRGTVIASAPGHTVIDTDAGSMLLKTPEAMPKGLKLTLQV